MRIQIRSSLDEVEKKITLYHEIIEGVWRKKPIAGAEIKKESQFDELAKSALKQFPEFTPESLTKWMAQFPGWK
jgi:hypothetical protein